MQNNIEVINMKPENTNSILVFSDNGDCVIFDAWGRASDWDKLLETRKLKLRAVYSTHGHGDHISATPFLAKKYDVPWYMNLKDMEQVSWANSLIYYFGLPELPSDMKAPTDLQAGEREILPALKVKIYDTPGHTKGGMVFYFPEQKVLITGDTIFSNGIGRYDLVGGDPKELQESVAKLKSLDIPDETIVIHGHGPNSTISELKENNPYFK